jgi:hypothetical protein
MLEEEEEAVAAVDLFFHQFLALILPQILAKIRLHLLLLVSPRSTPTT